MRLTTLLSIGFAFAGLVSAGSHATQNIDTETVYVVEFTEVCVCPTATALPTAISSPFTTLTCCPTCEPIPVTCTTQPITSCATTYKPTTTVCTEEGIQKCGDEFYPCWNPPCTIEYSAPCPTCYVCPYSDCWGPESDHTMLKHIEVYEYIEDMAVGYWNEEWECSTYPVYFTKTKEFSSPTIYIENNITINITVAPTVVTYTSTSTTTTTTTKTVNGSGAPVSRTTLPESRSSPPSSVPSSMPSAAPSGPSQPLGDAIQFVLKSGQHAGSSLIITGGKVAYNNDTATTFYFNGNTLYDADGHKLYISLDDLKASNTSLVFDSSSPPENILTDLFEVDVDGNLYLAADDPYSHLPLIFMICPGDLFIRVGTSSSTCTMIKIGETYTPSSSAPASIPASTHASSAPVRSPSGSVNPASDVPVSSEAPASSGSPASVTPISSNAPSVPSSGPSSPASSSPASSGAPLPGVTIELISTPVGQTINQAGPAIDETMLGEIDVLVYDQDNQPVSDAVLVISCSSGTLCLFYDSSNNLISGGMTDSNGEFKFFLSSAQRGSKEVLVSLPASSASNTTDWEVLPILDCQSSTFTAVAYRNGDVVEDALTNLIMNSDTVVLQSHIVDLFGDPLGDKSTSIQPVYVYPGKKAKRGDLEATVLHSDDAGNAKYTSPIQALDVVEYRAQFETCNDTHNIDTQFHYDPDCTDSSVTASVTSLPIENDLIISAQYAQNVGSLTGAMVNIMWWGGNAQVYLDSNNQANATVSYANGMQLSQTYNAVLVGASPACQKSFDVTWIRSCSQSDSTITFNNNRLATDEQLQVTITIKDSQGWPLEGSIVTVVGNLHMAPMTAVTDVNGSFTWNPPAPFGFGIEMWTATVAGECTLTNSMNWVVPT